MASITIQHAEWNVEPRYGVGHVLTENEASALNQTFFENIRNNWASRLKTASENGQTLSQDDLDKYVAEYQFGVRSIVNREPKDPIAAEERRLARAAVSEAIRAQGLRLKDVPDEQFDGFVDSINDGRFRAQAEQIVAAKKLAATPLNIDLSAFTAPAAEAAE